MTWALTFTLRCRPGTCGTGLALLVRLVPGAAVRLRVACVALGNIDLHFAWQVWRLATWTFMLRGGVGTCGTGLALLVRLVPGAAVRLCVACVALGNIDLHFVWQVWRLATWALVLCGGLGTCGIGFVS